MYQWILFSLSISIIVQHSLAYDDPTARVLDLGGPWKPVHQSFHTAFGPHLISLGAVAPGNNLQFNQIAQHNAQIMQQVKGLNQPVTQYRNPFPLYQSITPSHFQRHHHHLGVPKENPQHIHSSASNIAQTILPSNYLKPAPYITGKPAFNLKPEYITKPDFFNGIHTTIMKNQQIPQFKQIPSVVKQAMTSLFHDPSTYKDFILTPPPQFPNQHSFFSFKQQQQQQPMKDKPVGSFSFPGDGASSLAFFGPASHLIRGGKHSSAKPQATIFLPAEAGNNIKTIQQTLQPAHLPKSAASIQSGQPIHTYQQFHSAQPVQPIRYESSTPSYFGTTSVKISPSQSFELTFGNSFNGNQALYSTTTSAPPAKTETFSSFHANNDQPKSQGLPPIPASVLTPFFHHVQQIDQQKTNENTASKNQKSKFILDDYSKNLVPPPFIHLESSTLKNTPAAPTKRPISLQEQTNALHILNKYNIPVISPLQDANKFQYEAKLRKPTIIPLNYSVSSIIAFPTNAPQQTPLSIEPTRFLSFQDFLQNNEQHFAQQANEPAPPIQQKNNFNSEHSFFTIDDALTDQPIHQTHVSPTSVFNSSPTQVQVQENPKTIVNEHPSTLTTSPPRPTIQQLEHTTTTTTAAPTLPILPSSPEPTEGSLPVDPARNRLRGKNRRRRPRPTTSRNPDQQTENENLVSEYQEQVRERPTTSSSTTEHTVQRNRPGSRIRGQVRPVSALPSPDPTLKLIQRNSLRNRFSNVAANSQTRQPADYATTSIEYHPPSIKTTQPAYEELNTPQEEIFPSTTALANEVETRATIQLEEINSSSPSSSEEPLLEEIKAPSTDLVVSTSLDETSPIPTEILSQFSSSTEQIIVNQEPEQTPAVQSLPTPDGEPHQSHRQRYRYKVKTTPDTAANQEIAPSNEPAEIESSSSVASNSDSNKPVTKLRPVNKYRSQDRPRFSVKDYRQRVRTHSTTSTTTTEHPSVVSTSPGYRSRNRFPTRKRLLPSLRLRATTESSDSADTNGASEDEPVDEHHSNIPAATSTSTTTSRSTSFRRPSTPRRGYNNRYRATSTTEAPIAEAEDRKPVRQFNRDRYNHRSRIQPTSTENNAVAIQMNPEDLNDIAVETESPSSTPDAKPESAIMKITKTDFSSKQSDEVIVDEDQSEQVPDLNESPSEQSKRVAQLTLSGSSYKFNNLNKNNLSRRIPGYFTLATEDPILPIEAFFPNVKPMTNRSR